jgi:catechol 2,3-dioxygenase-like lactoylglutathione lyase family enzyme
MLVGAIPILQSLNIDETVRFYETKLGFMKVHQDGGFAIMVRDEVYINFTHCDDRYLPENTACRIRVTDVDSLYAEFQPKGIIHPNAPLETTDYGTKEFSVIDDSGNCIAFFERVNS